MLRVIALLFAVVVSSASVQAGPVLKTEKLAENVYALIGPLTNRDSENLGNNANFGVIVTDDGVVLIDSGATDKGARMIHAAIKEITDKAVTWVINSGGQDHRWMGNGYFKALGATIIASEKAVADQKARRESQLDRLWSLVGKEGLEGTDYIYADESFSQQKLLMVGDTRIEIHHAGHAHTPGDSYIWLPQHKIVFSGDIVYTDRMLGVGSMSAHKSWIAAFEAMAAKQPEIVVGGHGNPASLAKAKADTYDYLLFLREAVLAFMDQGNSLEDIGKIDQSRFSYLKNFDSLKGRNAQRVYEELEWE
ncbi:MAG: MBL fold metallo-hydrolase [Candidatus Thiodiazotropha taylori]|nr:MBL fold metallo-hydrolase [Candidatus Thiodiazotropha taylori]MCG8057527.1 MBL fold metallo-hydrolase [Candidatus Thiodiazotropha taylori]MCG8108830.1 MBL fold metallo-hydrolase [Candidatus Thiodiazotropha taylori]MCG8111637.1 MBL fold metallo-hydrolase [Candidatus Thiodiazotropha taylori]MCW4281166.1 MBL fold metallo-hydrolase [Candidatus Thiodiazotropha taylori]